MPEHVRPGHRPDRRRSDSKTETVSYLIFQNGLGNGEYAYQMANAVTFFIVLAILAFIQLKFFSGKEQI